MIRVVIVDNQEMILVGLRTIIEAQPGLEIVGGAADGMAAIALLDQTPADVVLMDIRMPGIDGVETTARLREKHSATALKIVVLTTFDQDATVVAALRAGANGFLSKGVGPAQLAAGIAEVTAIVSGLDNAQIAAKLLMSPFTVKTHASRAMSKVFARDRAQLVSFAVIAGIRP